MIGKMRQFATYVPGGLAALSLLYLVTIYGICYFAPGYGLFDDDGVYLVTAKSLAEGTGYRYHKSSVRDSADKISHRFFRRCSREFGRFIHIFPKTSYALKLVPLVSMFGWLC